MGEGKVAVILFGERERNCALFNHETVTNSFAALKWSGPVGRMFGPPRRDSVVGCSPGRRSGELLVPGPPDAMPVT